MLIETKVYPSTTNGQLQGPEPIATGTLIGYLQQLDKHYPGSKVRGWPGPVEIVQTRESTPLEDAQAKIEALRQELMAAGRDPLAERLLALLG